MERTIHGRRDVGGVRIVKCVSKLRASIASLRTACVASLVAVSVPACTPAPRTAVNTTPDSASYFVPRLAYGARRIYDESALQLDKVGDAYRISSGAGVEITENAFVRRYAAVTGNRALRAYDRGREPGEIAATAGLTLGSAFVAGVGIGTGGLRLSPSEMPESRASVGAGTAAVVGSVSTLVFGLLLVRSVLDQDGSVYRHDLPLDTTRAYVLHYNDVLLRRIAADASGTVEPPDVSGVREERSNFHDVGSVPTTPLPTPREQQIRPITNPGSQQFPSGTP
ncbi:MAG: hypothetical protein U0169_25370 [Polyangiaceae bacterium]